MTRLFFSDYFQKYCVEYNGKAVVNYQSIRNMDGIIRGLKNLGYIKSKEDLILDL